MPLTNFPFGVSSFGAPVVGGGSMPWAVGGGNNSPGRVFWCDPTNGIDSNDGLSPARGKATLSSVHSAMTANQNDVVYIIGNSSASATTTVRETATLVWSKDLCHIVGVNALTRMAHRVSLRPVTNAFTPFMTLSASGCVLANFHIFDNLNSSTSAVTMNITGERNAFYNLHIFGLAHTTAATAAGARNIVINTSLGENYWKDCTLGGDTVDRSGANATLEFQGGSTRTIFEDCYFIMRATDTSPVHIDADNNNVVDRLILFKNCLFNNFGSATIAEVMNIDANVNANFVIMNSHTVGSSDWEAVASTNLYVEAALGTSTSGQMVAFTT